MPATAFFDRVWAVTATTGTGAVTPGAALVGFRSFSAIGAGAVFPYSLVEGVNWESGIGTLNSDGTITRSVRMSSASGNAAITLAGNATILIDPQAVDLPCLSSSLTQNFKGGLTAPFLSAGSGNYPVSITTDSGNLANMGVGYGAMNAAATGTNNSAFGLQSLQSVTSGGGNLGLGFRAGQTLTTGSSNTFVGSGAGGSVQTGGGNIMLGTGANGTAGVTNAVVIGNNITAPGDSTITIGDGAGNIRYQWNGTNHVFTGGGIAAGTATISGDTNIGGAVYSKGVLVVRPSGSGSDGQTTLSGGTGGGGIIVTGASGANYGQVALNNGAAYFDFLGTLSFRAANGGGAHLVDIGPTGTIVAAGPVTAPNILDNASVYSVVSITQINNGVGTVKGNSAVKTNSDAAWDVSGNISPAQYGSCQIAWRNGTYAGLSSVGLIVGGNYNFHSTIVSIDLDANLDAYVWVGTTKGPKIASSCDSNTRFAIHYTGYRYLFYVNGGLAYSMAASPGQVLNGQYYLGSQGARVTELVCSAAPRDTVVGTSLYGADGSLIGLGTGNMQVGSLVHSSVWRKSAGQAVTLAQTDAGGTVSMSDSATALTIPTNASVPLPVGTRISVLSWCTAASQITRASGVALYWYAGNGTPQNGDRTLAIGASVTLLKQDTDTWAVYGQGIS